MNFLSSIQFKNKSVQLLLVFHALALVSICAFPFYGTLTDLVWVLAIYFLIGILGAEIGMHRLNSHDAFVPRNKVVEYVLIWLGLYSMLGTPFYYTAQHRNHHINSDQNEYDIQSPVIYGIVTALLTVQFTFDYKKWNIPLSRNKKYKAEFYKFTHRFYNQIVYGTAALIALVDFHFFLFSWIPGVMLSLYIFKIVNTFCHVDNPLCYARFDVGDKSKNEWFLGLISGGLGFHNNHHKYPTAYTTAVKWWEIDLSAYLIKLLFAKEVNEIK